MKHLKSKLMVAIAMLAISAVMLTGVSFAWYTISTNPEIKGITTSVSANENLEIALDNGYANQAAVDTASANSTAGGKQGSTTGNPYTWGNVVDLSYAYGTSGINGKLSLKPIKYTKASNVAALKYPKYGEDGRIASLQALTGFLYSDLASVKETPGTGETQLAGGVKVFGQDATKANNKTFDAMSTTYWIRANKATNITLTKAVKRASSGEDGSAATTDVNGVLGGGSYIRFPSTGTDASTANTTIYSWLTTGKLKIQFDVVTVADSSGTKTYTVTDTYYAYPYNNSATTPAKYTAAVSAKDNYYTYELALSTSATDYVAPTASTTPKTLSLTANTAKTIIMYVYIDGENITNADALTTDLSGMQLNIQFAGSDIDDAMDVGAY